ncbi:MAG: sensor histidine kinase, partial [Bacteroidetes bacterium]|nr:sensor histidine kinase [Bacteroidota bacterium]
MKKIIFTFLSFIVTLPVIYAQKGINFSSKYAAGGKLLICVDSSAKNVFYNNVFPNQPHTSFNYLPEVNNVSIQIYFRKEDSVQQYRYTILVDNKPMVVNQSFKNEQMKDIKMPEIYRSTSIGIFPIKGKIITILVYNIEKPLDIYKSVFYG